jgi:site-specific DNA-methyltransferase (adenine-specific)
MLKPTGSFYYHCDPTMSHYIKIMLDYVFGGGNFRNEIVWHYRRWTGKSQRYQKLHDTLLFYTKSDNYLFNIPYTDYTEGSKARKEQGVLHRFTKDGEKFLVSDGKVSEQGVRLGDVWVDIPFIAPSANERLGYPTQKPEALLERIIKASTNPTDLVADFFMGGGPPVATAAKLGRRFLGSDINERALQITQKRLEALKRKVRTDFTIQGIPKSSKQLKNLLDNGSITKYEFQDMICKYYIKIANVIPSAKKSGDDGEDGVFGFEYNGKPKRGIVQVTTGSNKHHFESFCSKVEHNADMRVYITFKDKITSGMITWAKRIKKIGPVDGVQILTVEDLVDKEKQFELPKDILTI